MGDGGEAREVNEARKESMEVGEAREVKEFREARKGSVEALVMALRSLESSLAGLGGDLGQGRILLGLEDLLRAAGRLVGDLQGRRGSRQDFSG